MATLEQLSQALINADKAGDADAARMLAGEITRIKGAAPSSGNDFATRFDAVSDEKSFRDVEVPKPSFGIGDTWPARLAKGIYSAVRLPGDVMQGNVSMSGEDGRTNPQVIERSAELASVASPLSPLSRMGIGWAGALKTPKGPAPTQEALAKSASAGYDAARKLGVEVAPQGIANLGHKITAQLDEMGINGELAPKTFSILNKIINPPADAVGSTVSNIETIRRSFGHAAGDFSNPTEQLAARRAKEHLADYLAAIPDQDVVRGPASEASKILSEATGNYAASKRASQITDAYDAADLSAAAANSGQNAGNATRQRIKSILLSDQKSAGYSPDELAQMEKLVRGTAVGNTTRIIGNLLGGGGGLGSVASAAVGAGSLGPIGAAAPAVGYGLKKLSDASVDRQAQALVDMILRRSPLGAEMKAAAPAEAMTARQQALARMLLGSMQGQQQ